MSSLTSEQQRIIEEKKQAALLKKQKLLQGNGPNANLNLNTTVTPQGKTNNVSNGNSYTTPKDHGSTSGSLKCVAASISVISDERFIVNMPYHNPSIEMFKTIPGKMYGKFFDF